MRGARSRRLATTTSLAAALLVLAGLGACSSPDAGKAASTPTSIGDEAVAPQVADLESALLSGSDLPGDFAKVAEVSFGKFDLCGQDILELAPPAGRLAIAHGNPEENLVLENLLVYTDATEAAAFMEEFSAAVDACETGDAGTPKATVRAGDAPDVGDRADAAEISDTDSSGRRYTSDMLVAQSGNIVVVVSSANLGEPPVARDVLDAALSTAVTKVKAAGDT
ncbi:MAG: hypothetical protein IT198_00625 [Acidimicrobiia bacterium]|nr:hypothetical protein [Acidimicrobiia bacterium]